jgi:exonuclease III
VRIAFENVGAKAGAVAGVGVEQGWIDTWRSRNPEAREFTWFSRGYNNGFRLDHALASPSLNNKVKKVFYSHQEREEGVTDHSLMGVDIDQ